MFIRSRRAPRRGPIVRALRWLLRQPPEQQRMTRRDWQLLAEERGATLAEERERFAGAHVSISDLERELRTKDRALKMSDEKLQEAQRRAHDLATEVQLLSLRLEKAERELVKQGAA